MGAVSKLDLVIHPVRSRIVSLVTDRELTATAIADLMPDVPRPSVYRHVNRLAAAGVLKIVREAKVRGATEKWLQVADDRSQLNLDEIKQMSSEERWALVNNLLLMLSADYRNALIKAQHELASPMICSLALHLTDKERQEFWKDLLQLVQRHKLGKGPEGRSRFSLGAALLPDMDPEGD
ncbi:MAG: helix-turn-helix domain-containing protein [Armatimonadetes bacterium]|nr:helix-turn-helix domain-containing protein [Armatimonadota bacterium]